MSEINYEEDLRIDPNALDIEWLEQADRFSKYSRLLAQAEREAKRADELVKTLRSELIFKANQEPDTCLGVGIKATDSKVEAYYRQHKDYVAAKSALHDKELERDLLLGAVTAFNQRKVALENLVRLQSQNYFAGPSEPRNISEQLQKRIETSKEDKAEAKTEEVREKMKRRLNRS